MEEKIFFLNESGIKLCGILSTPTSSFDVPVVILCHGFNRDKDNFTNTKLLEIFEKENIATFRFDFFGHGESEGEIEKITISECAENILGAINLLKQKNFSTVGLFGSSFGGAASIVTTSKANKISFLALKSPVSNCLETGFIRDHTKEEMEDWRITGSAVRIGSTGEETKLNYSFFVDCEKTKIYKMAEKIKVPTFIVHGEKDKLVPVKHSEKLSDVIESCQLEIIEGAGHKYSKENDFYKSLNLIANFIIKQIKH